MNCWSGGEDWCEIESGAKSRKQGKCPTRDLQFRSLDERLPLPESPQMSFHCFNLVDWLSLFIQKSRSDGVLTLWAARPPEDLLDFHATPGGEGVPTRCFLAVLLFKHDRGRKEQKEEGESKKEKKRKKGKKGKEKEEKKKGKKGLKNKNFGNFIAITYSNKGDIRRIFRKNAIFSRVICSGLRRKQGEI